MDGNFKRIKVALKTPNPLFRQWLKEFIDEATKRKRKISKTYQKALSSLEKYPLTLYSGHDCAILEGFGPKICELLEEKLQQHLSIKYMVDPDLKNLCYKDKIITLQKREHNELLEFIKDIEASSLTDDSLVEKTLKSLKNATNLSIIEEVNSDDEQLPAEKFISDECMEVDECLDNLSTKCVDEDSFDRLINKYGVQDKPNVKLQIAKPDIVQSPVTTIKNRCLKKFKSFHAVTNTAGPSFASSPISKFLNIDDNTLKQFDSREDDDEFDRMFDNQNQLDVLPSPILPKQRAFVSNEECLKAQDPKKLHQLPQENNEDKQDTFEYTSIDDINPLEYEVILLIDVGESKTVASDVKAKLLENGVKSDVRKLHVGDFLFIAKHKTISSKEYALPYIIERKRLDDLSSSIKDGRFHEQKFRLKQCGIKNVIYLIENYTKGGKVQCGLPFSTLLQAAANTQIHTKFHVKFTENCDHTGLYLAVMCSFIENIFKNKKPIKFKLLDFETFNQSSVKHRRFTVRETFIKQLLAFKGLSVDIAMEITKYYQTPQDLFNKYMSLSAGDGETLLSKITIGELKRKIPSTISKSVYSYYIHK